MTVLSDLVDLVLTLGAEKELPAVRGLYKPRPPTPTGRPKKFGVIALDDGSCGFFFAGLDDTLSHLDACDPKQFTEMSALELVKHCLGEDPLLTAVDSAHSTPSVSICSKRPGSTLTEPQIPLASWIWLARGTSGWLAFLHR